MADTDNVTLKSQYDLIQQRTQQNLAYRKKKKEEKEKKQKDNGKNNTETNSSVAFGVNDDLDLKLADPPSNHSAGISDALVDHLNLQIRELKDETGRLYKLLSERDHDVRQMRKRAEQQRVTSAAVGGNMMAGDAAAMKIVELSKKIRELTSELESEKSKCKQWAKKCFDMENEFQRNMAGDASSGNTGNHTASIYSEEVNEKQNLQNEVQNLQDRLKHSEQRCSEYRNQCQSLRQELKVAQKVLSNEVGEGANIQSLLNAPSGYRGRAQQIIALQKKVQELKGQVEGIQMGSRAEFDLEDEFMGGSAVSSATSRRSYGMDDRQKEQLRRMDRERKEANERMVKELKALEQDHESVKSKWDASKARIKVLSTEIKTLKQQITTLLEKGKHDDELIQALMGKQSQMKTLLEEQSVQQRDTEKADEERRRLTLLRQQQESNVVEQLKAIVAEKETKVKRLTDEISNMRISKSQMNGVQALFDESPRWAVPGDPQRSLSASMVREPSQFMSRQNGVNSARLSERGFSLQGTLHEEHEGPPTERLSERPKSTDRTVTDRPPSRPSSRKKSSGFLMDQAPSEESSMQYQEVKSLYQATEVERDRLRELITVLERRLSESTQMMLESQTELQGQRRKNVQLEKQLGKANVEQSGRAGGKKTSAGTSRARVSLKDSLDMDDPYSSLSQEELQTNLEIQRDENEALKMALQRTLKAKEEDLKLYNEIMEETKEVFLQGLKQYRQKSSES